MLANNKYFPDTNSVKLQEEEEKVPIIHTQANNKHCPDTNLVKLLEEENKSVPVIHAQAFLCMTAKQSHHLK